ncbi:hypothetical protein, partial [Streptomyces sp. NPDC005046]
MSGILAAECLASTRPTVNPACRRIESAWSGLIPPWFRPGPSRFHLEPGRVSRASGGIACSGIDQGRRPHARQPVIYKLDGFFCRVDGPGICPTRTARKEADMAMQDRAIRTRQSILSAAAGVFEE